MRVSKRWRLSRYLRFRAARFAIPHVARERSAPLAKGRWRRGRTFARKHLHTEEWRARLPKRDKKVRIGFDLFSEGLPRLWTACKSVSVRETTGLGVHGDSPSGFEISGAWAMRSAETNRPAPLAGSVVGTRSPTTTLSPEQHAVNEATASMFPFRPETWRALRPECLEPRRVEIPVGSRHGADAGDQSERRRALCRPEGSSRCRPHPGGTAPPVR